MSQSSKTTENLTKTALVAPSDYRSKSNNVTTSIREVIKKSSFELSNNKSSSGFQKNWDDYTTKVRPEWFVNLNTNVEPKIKMMMRARNNITRFESSSNLVTTNISKHTKLIKISLRYCLMIIFVIFMTSQWILVEFPLFD